MYKTYMSATSKLRDFNIGHTKITERREKADRKIKNHFYDLKRKLEDEESQLRDELKTKYDGYIAKIESKMIRHKETLKAIEATLEHIKIWIDGRDLLFLIPKDERLLYLTYDWDGDDKIEFENLMKTGSPWLSDPTYRKPFQSSFEPLETLAEDKYKRITIEIAQNRRKPTNKYDLYLCITSIFDTRSSYSKIIKSGPTKESLISYWERNKNKIRVNTPRWGNIRSIIQDTMTIPEILGAFKTAELEYETAVNLIKTDPDWRLIYLHDRKYYYENNYSQGVRTEEYKLICKQLNIPLPKPEEEENEVA